jgi:hypothetical protein
MITHQELLDFEKVWNSIGSFCRVALHTTEPKEIRKTSKFDRSKKRDFTVQKVSVGTYLMGTEYSNMVNNQRKREGIKDEFNSLKPTGKSYVPGSRLILEADNYVGRYYLALFPVYNNPKVKWEKYYFDENGEPIHESDLAEYVSDAIPSGSGRQGTEKEIRMITPNVQNIVDLKLWGNNWRWKRPLTGIQGLDTLID